MSIGQQLHKVFLILAISLALMSGAAVRPDQIEDLLYRNNQPRIEQIRHDEAEDDVGRE